MERIRVVKENQSTPYDEMLVDALHSARRILDMEVAFISRFENGRRFFKYVISSAEFSPVEVGDSDPLEESICQRIVDGRVPELMVNAKDNSEAQKLAVTSSLSIGAHVGVPIKSKDGHLYGTLCCFNRSANISLGQHTLDTMRCFAEFVGRVLEKMSYKEKQQVEAAGHILTTLEQGRFHTHYQPILDVRKNRPIGYEALTRFQGEPYRSPDKWFDDAAQVGLQTQLEMAAVEKALEALGAFPQETYISLNVSPETVLNSSLADMLQDYPLKRLVLEVTEHNHVGDYPIIMRALESLRRGGLRLAVDDAGAGYASFQHILKLRPDIIKLDRSLVTKIEDDSGSMALTAALVRFAEQTGSVIIAEGVETGTELEILSSLGVEIMQGYLFGRPEPAPQKPAVME